MTDAGIIRDQPVVKLPGLERCRFEASLMQRELAEKAQVARATSVRLERLEEARPPTMRRLAEALGGDAGRADGRAARVGVDEPGRDAQDLELSAPEDLGLIRAWRDPSCPAEWRQ